MPGWAGTHISRSLGHLQPLKCHRAARDVDGAPRILAIEDCLPGILRTNYDVLADIEHVVAAPCVGAIGEDKCVAGTGGVDGGLQRPCSWRHGRCGQPTH